MRKSKVTEVLYSQVIQVYENNPETVWYEDWPCDLCMLSSPENTGSAY